MTAILTVWTFGLASPDPLAAQEDPLADAPGFAPGEIQLGWRGNADFGFTLTEGNSQTTNLSVGARVIHRLERHRWTLSGGYLRATTEGEETANRGDAQLQYDFFSTPRFFVFSRMAASFNEPAGLDLRLSPAAGAGYRLAATDRLDVTVEGGGSWIRDAFVDGTRDRAFYAVLGQSLGWEITETTDVEQSLTYQPRGEDPGDFLLHSAVALSTMITDAVGLRVSFRSVFDSDPFVDPDTGEARKKNDLTFVTGVTYRF